MQSLIKQAGLESVNKTKQHTFQNLKTKATAKAQWSRQGAPNQTKQHTLKNLKSKGHHDGAVVAPGRALGQHCAAVAHCTLSEPLGGKDVVQAVKLAL